MTSGLLGKVLVAGPPTCRAECLNKVPCMNTTFQSCLEELTSHLVLTRDFASLLSLWFLVHMEMAHRVNRSSFANVKLYSDPFSFCTHFVILEILLKIAKIVICKFFATLLAILIQTLNIL